MKSVPRATGLVHSPVVGLDSVPRGRSSPSGAPVPVHMRRPDPGLLAGWTIMSPLVTETLVARPVDKWSHWDEGVTGGKN